jgi:hypothetical protein
MLQPVFATPHALTGGERSFYHFVFVFSSNPVNTQHALSCRPPSTHTHCGTVRSAAESCMLSSSSPPRNSSSDLRLILGGSQHESTSSASLLPRASARRFSVS